LLPEYPNINHKREIKLRRRRKDIVEKGFYRQNM